MKINQDFYRGSASCAGKRLVEKVLMWARVKDTEVLELTRSNDLENTWSWKIKYSEIFFNISVNSIILGIVVSYKIDNSSSCSSSGMFCWLTALDVVHMSLFFTAFCEDKSCEYFVNSGVHPVQLHAEDVEGGGVDVHEREVGEDARIRIRIQDPGSWQRGRSSFLARSHPPRSQLSWGVRFHYSFDQKLK